MDALRRVGRLLVAFTLALVSFLMLSGWLSRAAPDSVLRSVHTGVTSLEPTTYIQDTMRNAAGLTPTMNSPAQDYRPVQADKLRKAMERQGSALIPDPRVALMMDQILTETVVAIARSLTGEEPVTVGGRLYAITTRHSYSGEPISRATQYVHDSFRELGLDTTYHEYNYAENRWRNVVAERTGPRHPNEIYLITAHLDDLPSGPLAPGADDNASGSAAVLVAADYLSRLDLGCTLRFVLFTGEEQGLRGSAAYADAVSAAGDDVRGVLNLDMIGYNSDADPIVDLHARSHISYSIDIAQAFSQVATLYGLDLAPEILVDNSLSDLSDNKSFWDQGYPAILAIEDWDDFSPYYHTVSDTVQTLDLDFFTEMVKAAAGTFAHMGCPSTGLLSGTVIALDTGQPLPATVTALAHAYAYTTTVNDNGRFSLTLPVYTFTVRAEPSVPGYLPAVITNVYVAIHPSTLQHIILGPWPSRLFLPLVHKQAGN
jgi:hypothetical protein